MPLNSKRYLRLVSVIVITLFAATFMPPADNASADRRDKKKWNRIVVSPPAVMPGHVVTDLPRDHKRIRHREHDYFFSGGIFYSTGPAGFVVVSPPIGAIVLNLAIGFETVWVGGSLYYHYGGVFYRRVPMGYVVVAPPPTVIVVQEPPPIIQPVQPGIGNVTVLAFRLNVRTGPGYNYPAIYQVDRDVTLSVHGSAPGWFYVQLPNGQFGWVMSQYTTPLYSPASG